jgi:hypothetical protein
MSENNYNTRKSQHDGIFTKRVGSGKRTYFFDVRATKSSDYYITVTESKKQTGDDGNPFYTKHKIYVYREDLERFMEGLAETVSKLKELRENGAPAVDGNRATEERTEEEGTSFTDVSFEDLK